MALDKQDLTDDLVALIVANDPTLTADQVTKLNEVMAKLAEAITNQILRGRVVVSGPGTYPVL